MALKGKNQHYHWHLGQRRQFLSTAKAVNFSSTRMEEFLDEMLGRVDEVIETVAGQIPEGFPNEIAEAIFEGMQAMRDRLVTQ